MAELAAQAATPEASLATRLLAKASERKGQAAGKAANLAAFSLNPSASARLCLRSLSRGLRMTRSPQKVSKRDFLFRNLSGTLVDNDADSYRFGTLSVCLGLAPTGMFRFDSPERNP